MQRRILVALALAAADAATQRDAWTRASAGYVGTSDGWQDFAAHGAMTWSYDMAGPGHVALIGELGPSETVLALGFGPEGSRGNACDLSLASTVRNRLASACGGLGGVARDERRFQPVPGRRGNPRVSDGAAHAPG